MKSVKGALENIKRAKNVSKVKRAYKYRFYPSSKTCSGCGSILETLTLDVREWSCKHCGVRHDRDVNAAYFTTFWPQGLRLLPVERMSDLLIRKAQGAILVEAGSLTCEGGNPLPFQAWGGYQEK